MPLETKFLRLRTPVTIGSRFGDWEVSWLGGWTRNRLCYLVMVVHVPLGSKRSQASCISRECNHRRIDVRPFRLVPRMNRSSAVNKDVPKPKTSDRSDLSRARLLPPPLLLHRDHFRRFPTYLG